MKTFEVLRTYPKAHKVLYQVLGRGQIEIRHEKEHLEYLKVYIYIYALGV